MNVSNYMEIFVKDKLDQILTDSNVCRCEICRSDTAAIALNNLKPRYYSTETGFLYSKIKSLEFQVLADVVAALAQAADVVRENPRHEK